MILYPCSPRRSLARRRVIRGLPRRSLAEAGEIILLFLAELLESGIAAQRIPERIEPKKGWRDQSRTVDQRIAMP